MRQRRAESKARPGARHGYRALAASCLVSIAVLVVGLAFSDHLDLAMIGARLLWPLIRLMAFITLGLVVGQVIEASGWTRHLSMLAGPLFRFARLGRQCAAAFTTAFFSGVAANAMLLDFYKDGKITRGQLYLTNFINQMPAYFLHLPTTFFIVIPLTGRAGALYFLLTFVALMARTAAFVTYGHLRGGRVDRPTAAEVKPSANVAGANEAPKAARAAWEAVRAKLPRRIVGIGVYVLPIYVLVFVINSLGLFAAARQWMAGYAVTTFMPMESLSVVILSFAAEFTSGFAAAGALLEAGVLTVKQTVLALLIGNILAFPVRALRHQLPRYIGIFSPKMGTQLLLMGQGFRMASLIAVGIGYYLIA